MRVNFLGPINLSPIDIDVKTFEELKAHLNSIDALKEWLPTCAIALNDDIILDSSSDTLNNLSFTNNDSVSLLPPVCGG